MLKLLRKRKVAKKIFYFLAIIIIPAFVLWGTASTARNKAGNKGYAGKIFGKKVSFNQYAHELQGWRMQLRLQHGEQAQQLEKFVDANKATWDRLILKHEVDRRNISVSDKELSRAIMAMPLVQRDGVFNQELYDVLLQYVFSMQPHVFEEYMREALQMQKLFGLVTNGVTVSAEEIRKEFEARARQIKVHYVSAAAGDFEDEIKPTDEELKNYYQENKQRFAIPLQIKVAYIGFDYPADASDEQKEAIEQKATALDEFLESNSNDLAAAQETFGTTAQETDYFSLGENIPGLDWMPDNLELLFNLDKGERSQRMDTPRGPYFFLLRNKRTDYQPPFEAIKDKVRAAVKDEKARRRAKEQIDKLYSQIKEKKESDPLLRLPQIAQQLHLSLKETDFFGRYSSIPAIGFAPQFNDVAFALAEGGISEIIAVENAYYIIALSGGKPFDESEFTKAKSSLEQLLLQEKKTKVFEDFMEGLRAKASLQDLIPKDQTQTSPPLPQ